MMAPMNRSVPGLRPYNFIDSAAGGCVLSFWITIFIVLHLKDIGLCYISSSLAELHGCHTMKNQPDVWTDLIIPD